MTVFGMITRRSDQMARHGRQGPGDQRRVGEGGDADCRIIALANEIDEVIAEMKVDGDVRILRQKLRQDRGDVKYTKRDRRRQTHAPARHGRLCDDLIFRRLAFR